MEWINRGKHKVLKIDKDKELVITSHFLSQINNRKINNPEKKILKIIKSYNKFENGNFYNCIFDDGVSIKIKKYYNQEFKLIKLDIITALKDESFTFKKDINIYL